MSRREISVSILNMDFARLGESIKIVEDAGADSLHMDIMDGNFVENISFGPDVVSAVKRVTSLPVHTHLMILKPEKYVERFFEAGSDTVTFHVETMNKKNQKILDFPHTGLSLNPDIPLTRLEPYYEKINRVLVMSVFAGFGGQKFIPESVKRIKNLSDKKKKGGLNYLISVDGGVNSDNAGECFSAGAQEIIAGSYITRSREPGDRIKSLRSAIAL